MLETQITCEIKKKFIFSPKIKANPKPLLKIKFKNSIQDGANWQFTRHKKVLKKSLSIYINNPEILDNFKKYSIKKLRIVASGGLKI